jgi:DNA polymerase-3 subunit alpha
MKACALTDHGNLYGAVSFYNTLNPKGIKPIIGYEAYVAAGSRFDRSLALKAGEKPYYRLVLLASDLVGYRNLTYLASMAFTEGYLHRPRIDMELLAERSSGLIALSSGPDEQIGHYLATDDRPKAEEAAKRLEDIFGKGRFFLEIQDHERRSAIDATKKIIDLAKHIDIPLVVTNDVQYMHRDDVRAQQALIALADGRTLAESGTMDSDSCRYLRSAAEMWDIFGGELPEALTNTVKIAEMCELELPQGDKHRQLPNFPIPKEFSSLSSDEYFALVVKEGFDFRRLSQWDPQIIDGSLKHPIAEYEKRLDLEIDTIRHMGFSGYFLIVWDFIKYAREKGIPVGPGRGSAAGSLVAYCLRITDVDPLQHELLFERFLNPERISMPDIDIDFCIRGRGQVIDHVTELYGRDSVCQIVTFGTLASRAAIKDIGRVLGIPYGDVDRIARMIPPPVRGRNVPIASAIKEVPELAEAMKSNPRIKELVELALKVEGCARHTSVHAAGVVISPKPLHELVPIAVSGKDELTSQFPMNDLEKVGMLKMDFLGLTTLTVIADCISSIEDKLGIQIDWAKIPTNDEKTLGLFGEGKTEAIFQFESSGMADMCRRLKPGELEDLSALNALYRPGPLDGGMIDDFIDRHRGLKPVEYIVPEMEEILGNTFGVLVYQEQIMQLAQKLAGYSLGDADLMRRAMGKKNKKDMDEHKAKFVDRAVERGQKRKTATEIFELMNKFADYGFNRSHSMAYAVLAFRTAYLKAHFPAHFYASVLSHEAQDSAKVYKYSNELRSIGLSLLPPDINESDEGFTPGEGAVRFGLTAIKGMGSSSVRSIVDARRDGQFTSLFDFCSRLGPGSLNRRGLESLISAGAFDSIKQNEVSIGNWRANLFASIEPALQNGHRVAENNARGQNALFGSVEVNAAAATSEMPEAVEWSKSELSNREKAAIGFYLTNHPLDSFSELIDGMGIRNIGDFIESENGDPIKCAGMVSLMSVRNSKRGKRYGMFRLEDRSGGIKVLVGSEILQKYFALLKDDEIIVADGRVESSEGREPTLFLDQVISIEDAVARNARQMNITLPSSGTDKRLIEDILVSLDGTVGGCEVFVNIPISRAMVRIQAPNIRIGGSRALQRKLEEMGCGIEWIRR